MDGMNGNIAILSSTGWAVSNNAELDYEKEIVETTEGRRSVGKSMFTVKEPFGQLVVGEQVKVAFQAEDGMNKSYRCGVETNTRLLILEELNEYKQILERILSWQQ